MKSKHTIQEKLGVPDGLPEAAREIWKKYIPRLLAKTNYKKSLAGEDSTILYFDSPLKVGKISIESIAFTLQCDITDDMQYNSVPDDVKMLYNFNTDVVLSGMANRRMPSGLNFSTKTKNFTYSKSNPDSNQFKLKFMFVIHKDVLTKNNPSEYLKNSVDEIIFSKSPRVRNHVISVISHELSHHYTHSVTSNRNIRNVSRQQSIQKFGSFPFINTLFFNLYKTDDDEMHVYSSEFKSILDSNKVTKSKFKKYLLNSDIYKNFKEIENYTYNEFISEIHSNMSDITDILKNHHPDQNIRNNISSMSTAQKTDLYLKHAYELYTSTLADIHLKIILGQLARTVNTGNMNISTNFTHNDVKDDVIKIINSVQNKVKGRKNAYIYFWKSLIELTNRRAKNVIKKISKLYDTLPSEDELDNDVSESHMIYKNFFKIY